MRACMAWKIPFLLVPSFPHWLHLILILQFPLPFPLLHFGSLRFTLHFFTSYSLYIIYKVHQAGHCHYPAFFLRLWLTFNHLMPTSIKNSKTVKTKLIISTLLYLKSLSSPLFLTSLNSKTIQLLNQRVRCCPLWVPQSWHSIAGRSTFLRTYTNFMTAFLWLLILWCKKETNKTNTLKLSGTYQPFYYAHVFCGWGIWTEDNEGGLSLFHDVCDLRQIKGWGQFSGWRLASSESIFTHIAAAIFRNHNLQQTPCYYEYFLYISVTFVTLKLLQKFALIPTLKLW